MGRMDGRRVLVVGASKGIGRAIGMACSGEGASVAFAARTVEKLESAVEECGGGGGKAVAIACDADDEASCRNAVAQAVEAMGGLDALVYSAGISRFTELEHATLQEWKEVFATNVFGAAMVTAAAIPHLREAKGHAIYLSSESALYQPDSWTGNGIYIASKIAMESVVRSFHTEVPEVAFTNYIVGATMTEFDGGDMEKMQGFVEGWFAKGYIRPVILMPETHGEAVVNILTSPGYMDVVSVRAR